MEIDETEEKVLKSPEEFAFPFTPYDIQHDFMSHLYNTINTKKLGIFESPTGTGKSLSIICGAIKWLKDYNEFERETVTKKIEILETKKNALSSETKDWLSMQSQEIDLMRKLNVLKLEQSKMLLYDETINKLKETKKRSEKKYMEIIEKDKSSNEELSDIKLEEIEDEDILFDDNNVEKDENSDNEDDTSKYEPVKIYICSRTHSQLSQFVGEIIKSPFGRDIRAVSLASRQNYCINPNVTRLKSMALINERCVDMQKNVNKAKKDVDGKVCKKSKGSSCKCPFYKQQVIDDLKKSALSDILDVEDLVSAGKKLKACPYYASRKAAEDADVILVPYNTLLHKATREANGIKLKNNVLIIDEAHNLLESLAQMHNSELNFIQLEYGLLQLQSYKKKFNTRFSAKNLLSINQLIFIISKLKSFFEKNMKNLKEMVTEIFTIENFVVTSQIDNFNMFKLLKFCKESKIAQKIRGYALKYPVEKQMDVIPRKGVKDFLSSIENRKDPKCEESSIGLDKPEPTPSNPLVNILSFLESLTYSYEDGRILMVKNVEKKLCKLQFLLLNPSSKFSSIVNEARSVIVAGGTMKPTTEFRNRLFTSAGAKIDRIVEFSCDHIIPPENILPIVLTKAPNGDNLLFNFDSRMKMGNNIKCILNEACKKIKGGIVVFFPSYQYENWVWQHLKEFSFGRPVFREPKESGSVDVVLDKYAEAIRKPGGRGALMFSVVGGKLSEGLNFSDDLGRCVIVVGLPYANVKAADLKEKMTYFDRKEGFGSGQKFYENLCMKAVNQCIGRAVRHKGDYAAVLLLDERYNRTATKNALPDWIKRRLQVCDFASAFGSIEKFFGDK